MPSSDRNRHPFRHRLHLIALLVGSLSMVLASTAVASPPGSGPERANSIAASAAIPDSYIVLLDDEHPGNVAADHARRHGADVGAVYTSAVRGYAATIPARAVAAIERDPRVRSVEPNYRATAYEASDPIIPTGLDRSAITPYLADGDGEFVTYEDAPAVAVLDTGIERGRDALNVVERVDCVGVFRGPPVQRRDDGDCVAGSDVADDTSGHGTHVAGTIGASGEILGVAPKVPLYAVRVLSDSGGSFASIIGGIDWVVDAVVNDDANIGVINLSLGSVEPIGRLKAVDEAIEAATDAGIVTVAAAGNEDDDASDYTPGNSPDAITVGALSDLDGQPGAEADPRTFEFLDGSTLDQPDDTRAFFSNWGEGVEIAAPGVDILSTVPEGTRGESGGYALYSGTSMAAPRVAGAVALALADAKAQPEGDETVSDAIRRYFDDNWTVAPTSDCGYGEFEDGEGKSIGPLLYIGGEDACAPEEITDVAVSLDLPEDAVIGDTVEGGLTIANVGNQDVSDSFEVTMTVHGDGVEPLLSETLTFSGLEVSQVETKPITWDTTGLEAMTYTVTASHNLGVDDVQANDEAKARVTLAEPRTDVQLRFASVPTSAEVGDRITVEVTVSNAGNQDVGSFDVDLTATAGTVAGPGSVAELPAGEEATLTFTWDTNELADGTYTLTASHDLTDGGAETSVDVELTEPGDDLATYELELVDNSNRVWFRAEVLFTVVDSANPSGVELLGNWTGGLNGSGSCTTDDTGTCTIDLGGTRDGEREVTFIPISPTSLDPISLPAS